ncbi:DUF4232 domain-containing protein [Streptomyces sp. HB132]|uniref:DUF4232 domain-containing protein n=1 Tax=Streptomyces sp. HB132 TaxID=767388 RepID=UPI0019602EDE|nr:DUF4232 domain-containing protein [Streptomyces sp. HB132]MBM7439662.1 hypothetical protein [Streptomyces sp. HB132]
MRLRTTSTALAVAAAAALSLAACSDGVDTGPVASASTEGPSGTGESGGPDATEGSGGGDTQASASASGPASSSTSSPVSESGDACRTADLAFSSAGGMAEGEVLIGLRNTGSASCSMRGFPGLDLESKDGTVSAERRSGRPARTVTLAPGESTGFSLYFPPNTGGSGVTFTSAVVTPPDETHSHRMSLSVDTAVDSGSGIAVTPVGSGK